MNKKHITRFALLALLAVLLLVSGNPVPALADGNNSLNPSAGFTIQGDFVAAGVGLRGTGTGNITISAIPAGATVSRAFLYWATLGNANTFTSPTLNGEEVQGELIGTSGDTCWGVQNNFVYRADVTALVAGNGTYSIAGLPGSLAQGNDSQGASLVVVYSNPSLPQRTIVINDGAVSLDFANRTHTDTIRGFTPDSPVTDAHVTYLIGDGQAMWDAGNITFNDTPIASGVFSGVDGNYWGTHSFDVTGLVSTGPATTRINNTDPDNPASPDCVLWAATIFSVTSGMQQEAENNMSQFMNISLTGDVTVAGVGLRGTGQGNITVTGIPSGAQVQHAFLYWATIGNSGQFTSPLLDGVTINGELIGVSADTCWGAQNNFVYRANVTPLVPRNGSYRVSGLPNNLSIGNDSQGAGLVVIYQIPGLHRTIIINDGAVTLDLVVHSFTDTISGFTADQPAAQARITYIVGDGQSRWDNGNVTFEGTSIARNVFTGVDGDYWGTLTFDVTGLVVEPDATTTINNNDPANPDSPDCLLWGATVFSVETERPVLPETVFFPLIFNEYVTEAAPVVTITPESGPVGTRVQVEASGFPANTIVDIGRGRVDSEFDVIATGLTDPSGELTTEVSMPDFGQVGEEWVIVVTTRDVPPIRAVSNPFLITP